MKNLLFLAMITLVASFAACEMGDLEQEETIDMDALRAEIQAMEDAYAKAQNARDAEAVVAYYADDAVSLGPNQPPLVGKAAILADIRANMAEDTTSGVTTRFEVVDLFADGDLAVEVGRTLRTGPDGTERETGKYISVFERRDGKWICIRDIYNSSLPDDDDDDDDDEEDED